MRDSTLITSYEDSLTAKIFHPLLSMIASASNNELARYVEFLKEENKILRSRIPGQIHTKPDERSRLVKLVKALGPGLPRCQFFAFRRARILAVEA